jgi:hypothetical protein
MRAAPDPAIHEVRIVVPPGSEYLRAVRMVAADAAVRAGLDCEEVEDFRIGVDELSHAVMSSTDHHLDITFLTSEDTVTARGRARGRGVGGRLEPAIGDLSTAIVAGVCDTFDFGAEQSDIVFRVVKRARRALVSPG